MTNTSLAPRTLRTEWAALAGQPTPTGRFDAGLLAQLPEPSRRWLGHAIEPGTPLWPVVELTMTGQIKLDRWRPFTAREVLAPPHGFIWAATARVGGLPVTGFDRFRAGSGQMRWRLLGLLPVMTGRGPDVTRSAAGRLVGEGACWLPTAFGTARWSAGRDADTAVATWRIAGEEESSEIRVAADGRLVEAGMQRWGNPDGEPYGRYPFGITVDTERTFGGVTIPASIRAGWWWGTDRQDAGEFFSAEITGAVFR